MMSDSETVAKNESEQSREPYQVRLPGFAAERSVGLGDAVSGLAKTLGFRPCGGCAGRAATLNRWIVFTR
jgi:hypothetical protein